jgi:uncharacterized protein YceH (UPF0502 family)
MFCTEKKSPSALMPVGSNRVHKYEKDFRFHAFGGMNLSATDTLSIFFLKVQEQRRLSLPEKSMFSQKQQN